jgi:hypothetical protein
VLFSLGHNSHSGEGAILKNLKKKKKEVGERRQREREKSVITKWDHCQEGKVEE